jgi:electron transfer flavoprotein beta subunit
VNVIVLVKSIPDPGAPPRLEEDFTLDRDRAEAVLDPGDEHGVEAALQLAGEDGEVTAVTMGPEKALAAVRKALSMGAHRGVMVTDPALAGADVLATARVLAAAVRRRPFDLVVAGVESTDGSTGTLPMTVAELLGLPSATFARRVGRTEAGIRIERQTEAGYDVVDCPLPALVTVTAGANEPRYPTLKGIMQARQKPLDVLSLADLGLAAEDVAPTQEVVGVEPVPEKGGGEVLEDLREAAERVVDLLERAKVI